MTPLEQMRLAEQMRAARLAQLSGHASGCCGQYTTLTDAKIGLANLALTGVLAVGGLLVLGAAYSYATSGRRTV